MEQIISKDDFELFFSGENEISKKDYEDYINEKAQASLTVFENKNFGKVRTIFLNNIPLLCLKDVCEILDIKQASKLKTRLKQDGVITSHIIDRLGRKQKALFINESNLYKVIFQSRKPEAEAFTEWVTADVLPAIRKTGGYIAGEEELNEDELVMKAMNVLNSKVERLKQQNKQLENKVEQDRPKVLFADSVAAKDGTILVRELAKIIQQNGVKINVNQLFNWLRDNGYLIKQYSRDYNKPTKKSIDLGIMRYSIYKVDKYGEEFETFTPLITVKGIQYFLNIFLNNNR